MGHAKEQQTKITFNVRTIRALSLGEGTVPSPLIDRVAPESARFRFIDDDRFVRCESDTWLVDSPPDELWFEKAGPRPLLWFNPATSRAAIVTCGGLCPGLNAVIRSLWIELFHNYGVPEIFGVRHGYRGLNPAVGEPPVPLTRDTVSGIHHRGGTILGSSRGVQPVPVMVDTLDSWGVNMLFCVGGDGTLRGADAITDEVKRRGLNIAVVGVPKTIDNDILYCDRTFGLVTAIEEAARVLHAAHVEAKGAARGIGLVRVMGRDAGFIACGAALASQEANVVLIPEVPFQLEGDSGLFKVLERRMDLRDHAVIVVAEGAGQHLFDVGSSERDASGNLRHQDIGVYLKDRIIAHFKTIGKPVDIKYIDPSYIIRSAPANTDDQLLCDYLARNAVHAAMAGRTDMVVCFKANRFMHVPIEMAVASKQRVDPTGRLWFAVLAATGQPASIG